MTSSCPDPLSQLILAAQNSDSEGEEGCRGHSLCAAAVCVPAAASTLEELVSCPFSVFGCTEKHTSSNMSHHISTRAENHISLLMSRVRTLESENTQLKDQLSFYETDAKQQNTNLEQSATETLGNLHNHPTATCKDTTTKQRGRKRSYDTETKEPDHRFTLDVSKTEPPRSRGAKKPKKTDSNGVPPAPKKPKTAYNYFQSSIRKQIQYEVMLTDTQSTREERSQKVARIIGERWKALSEDARCPFQVNAEKDKFRYRAELESRVATQLSKQRHNNLMRMIALPQEAQDFVEQHPTFIGWTVEVVGEFVAALGLSHLKATFAKAQINGRVFLQLQENELTQLNVTVLGERKAILGGIKQLHHTIQDNEDEPSSSEAKVSSPPSPTSDAPSSPPRSPTRDEFETTCTRPQQAVTMATVVEPSLSRVLASTPFSNLMNCGMSLRNANILANYGSIVTTLPSQFDFQQLKQN